MKKPISLLILLFITSMHLGAQRLHPLRVDVEYNQGLWLEAEYAFPIASTTLGSVAQFWRVFGKLRRNRLWRPAYIPSAPMGMDSTPLIGGVYTYDSSSNS